MRVKGRTVCNTQPSRQNPPSRLRLRHHAKSAVPDLHVIAIWALEGTSHNMPANDAVWFRALEPFANQRNTIPVHLPATLG